MSAAQYRILSPDGIAREDGQVDADVTAGAFVLAPAAGRTLHIRSVISFSSRSLSRSPC